MDPRSCIESRVETHYLVHTMALHDRNVKCITGGNAPHAPKYGLCGFDICRFNGEDFVDDSEERIECGLHRVAAVDCDIAMENLLEDFGVSHQPFLARDRAFEKPLRIDLARMVRAHQVHRDVRVDENHEVPAW